MCGRQGSGWERAFEVVREQEGGGSGRGRGRGSERREK